MAHELDMTNGRANIAYTGAAKPWHGLGFQIDPQADLETWRQVAGLDWEIRKGGMLMQREDGQVVDVSGLNRSILYRSDTGAPLSVMSTDGYHVVQPAEILNFIGDSVKAMGWEMNTAGSLKGGRKIWALAKIGERATIGKGDDVEGYLLAATACDGSMASEFRFTSVRVVCNNTLHAAVTGTQSGKASVKVYHSNKLDVGDVKKQLGVASSVWANFIENAKRLATIKVDNKTAVQILRKVYESPAEVEVEGERISDDDFLKANMTARKVVELFVGGGIGSQLASARGTAWGLVNATTEYYDHATTFSRSADSRMNSAWFGTGADRKQEVFAECLKMAA